MKTTKAKGAVLALFVLAVLSGPARAAAAEIHLSAAASLSDAVKALAAAFRHGQPQVVIRPNFGSSGALAEQIVQGAPADLFISANRQWMDHLVREGRIEGGSVRVIAANTLVFAGRPGVGVASLAALPQLSRIALGSPRSVPAGQYAEQAMRAVSVYEKMLSANQLVMARDVRQALLYADRGEVDGAFIYKSDALLAGRAVILFTVPAALHERIDCPAGLTPEGSHNEAARSLLDFLATPAALAILERFGFVAPAAGTAGGNHRPPPAPLS
ncbi:MAG: molybdate ABC transporter substrate-binding protein [Thermodesulfobacteriota bacterium]